MSVPVNLGLNVTTKKLSWMQMVVEAWGEDWAKWEVVYELEGGNPRLSTDYTNRGIYNGGAH